MKRILFNSFLAAVFLATAAFCALSNQASAQVTLLSEDFEGLALQNATSPTETAQNNVWTDVPPSGWSRDNSTTPVGSPAEFFGWTFANKDWWIATEGGQSRASFTRGQGTIVVADADAYDDGTNIDDALFNVFLSTPAIDLTGVAPGSVVVSFDSSWRNEETQDGRFEVSYDGGATYQTVLQYDSSDPVFGPNDSIFIDEALSFNLNNPGSGTAIMRWGLVEGSNDWWWAIDNVQVVGQAAIPEPSTLALVGLAGLACVILRRKAG